MNVGLQFTPDELTVLLEALREYHLRVASNSPARKLLCEALGYRLRQQLVTQIKGAA